MKPLSFFAVIYNFLIIILAVSCDITFLRSLIVLQMLLNIVFFVKGKRNIFTTGLIFFLFICLFHYGIFVDKNPILFELNDQEIFEALRFSMMCISAICIGYFLRFSDSPNIDVSQTIVALDDNTKYKLRKFSWILLAITIIPKIYMDILAYTTTYTLGYAESYSVGHSNKWLYLLSRFANPTILVLFFSYYDNKKIAKRILIIFSIYMILNMFSGQRAGSIIYITTFIYIYARLFLEKIRLKHIIQLALIVTPIIILITIIGQMRLHSSSVSLESIENSAQLVGDNEGVIKSFLYEFGSTLVSVAYPIKYLVGEYNYGLTYIYGFFNISPSIPEDILDVIINSISFVNALKGNEFTFLGGSCIGELYYNFAWFSPFFAIIIGWFLRKIDTNLIYVDRKNLISFLFYISILPQLFLWVRGYYCQIIFVGFWIPFLYKFMLKNLK